MFKVLSAFLVLSFSVAAMAEKIEIFNQDFHRSYRLYWARPEFSINPKTKEPSVRLELSHSDHDHDFGTSKTVAFEEYIKVPGLVLVDNQVVLKTQEGDVVCGKYGRTWFSGKPILVPNKNCKLKGSNTWAPGKTHRIVKVTLETK